MATLNSEVTGGKSEKWKKKNKIKRTSLSSQDCELNSIKKLGLRLIKNKPKMATDNISSVPLMMDIEGQESGREEFKGGIENDFAYNNNVVGATKKIRMGN